jgi:glutathione S-transferase
VGWDAASQAVLVRVSGYVEDEALRDFCNKAIELMVSKRSSKLITDSREMKPLTLEDQRWIDEDWRPRAWAAGLRRNAILVPTSAVAKLSVTALVRKFDEVQFGYFSEMDEARKWLTQVPEGLCIVGRPSSHFTRVTRLFAEELGLEYQFELVRDLLSRDSSDYAGNPALRLPVLKTPEGAWFGALNICRELARRSGRQLRVVWPEHLELPLLANAQELTLQGMATEVSLIMGALGGPAEPGPHAVKLRTSLMNTLAWLDQTLPDVLAALPAPRDLSFLEVTLFCFVEHLAFREVLPLERYKNLLEHGAAFRERPSAAKTPYQFQT